MPETPVTGRPASLNEIQAYYQFNGAAGTNTIFILPAMEGTQGNPVKNFERSPVLRSDRQGGQQIGGTKAGEFTVVLPIIEETSVKLLFESLVRGTWSVPFVASPETKPTGTLKPGTTRKPFTFEIRYTVYNDAGAPSYIYERFLNAEVNRATVNIPVSGAASVTMEILATSGSVETSPLSATAGDFHQLEGSVPMASAVTGCKFGYGDKTADPAQADLFLLGAETATVTLDNQGEIKYRIGSDTADHVTQGDFDATMSAQVYYRNDDLLAFFTAETRKWFKLVMKTGDDATTWGFHLPNGVINTYSHATSGPTVTENINVFGEYSSDADALAKFILIEG